MASYVKYLDNIPQIPDILIQELLNTYRRTNRCFFPYDYDNYRMYHINRGILKNYLKSIFSKETKFFHIHVMNRDVDIHKDLGRDSCYNYIINSGGPNVLTNHYDDNKNLIHSIKIEENRWHLLNSETYHNVTNLKSTRLAISVTSTLDCFYTNNRYELLL
jgi:hypothetical protein